MGNRAQSWRDRLRTAVDSSTTRARTSLGTSALRPASLAYAEQLLQTTPLHIEEIALQYGFGTIGTFYRWFNASYACLQARLVRLRNRKRLHFSEAVRTLQGMIDKYVAEGNRQLTALPLLQGQGSTTAAFDIVAGYLTRRGKSIANMALMQRSQLTQPLLEDFHGKRFRVVANYRP